MIEKSVIIIGGGLGGLFCGAILAKEGLKVTVLEKNAIIGGGLQSFSRFGELYDTGMHIIGGMQEDGNIRRICEYLGIWDRVHMADVDPKTIDTVYFSEDKKTYTIAQGRARYVETLIKDFPEQKANLQAYIEALYRVASEVGLFYLKTSTDFMQVHSEDFLMSADAFIAKYISDEHLRSVVAYLNPLYGGRGNFTPAYVHALISVLYIDGPSRFAGGSVLYAYSLRDFIEEHGGEVIASDAVVSVRSENKRISEIITAKGESFRGDYYICAVHPCTFLRLLDDPTVLPKVYRNRLDAIPNAYSAFTLNLKLKPGSVRYFNHTKYYMTRYDAIWKFADADSWPCGFLFITPPEINQGEYSTKMIVTAPMQWKMVQKWENTSVGQRGSDYVEWKKGCADKLLDCLEEFYPDIRRNIIDMNTASPLTIRDFYGVKEGSMCGFAKNYNDLVFSQVPVVTKVPNLFLTGQNCNLHGFCGVSLTAINTCEAILGQNSILDKINRFDDIRPFYNWEMHDAMRRIADNATLKPVASYVFPDRDFEELRAHIGAIDTHDAFLKEIMHPAIRQIIHKTCSSFSYDGLEKIGTDEPCLFVSNHRDIMLDASLLLVALVENGYDVPEITFGANLMKGDFVIDVGKANKMFRVERPSGNIREFYKSSEHVSDYIRNTIVNKKKSIWIAQRNGRTKDGRDRTDQGIVRMFAMSGNPSDPVRSVASLNIVPVSLSYEWEPCDLLKAVELYKSRKGPYVKKENEDLNSIVTGVMQRKGAVHIHVCDKISEEELEKLYAGKPNAFFKAVASLIDKRICSAYRLYPNNYIASDIKSGTSEFSEKYTGQERRQFVEHLSQAGEYSDIILDIYANPVDSQRAYR